MGLAAGRIARELGRWIPPAALRRTGQPAALFFHGVERRTRDPQLQTNHHEVAHFRAILSALKQFDFDVLPLGAIDDVMAQPEKYSRSLFLMSDDGYRYTLGVAADILDEFRMPWKLFVSTAHIGSSLPNPAFLAWLFFLRVPRGQAFLLTLKARPSNAATMFASPQMARLIDILGDACDFVILDCGPTLSGPDASLIARHADATLLVSRREKLQARSLVHATQALQNASAAPVGLVLAS